MTRDNENWLSVNKKKNRQFVLCSLFVTLAIITFLVAIARSL